VRLYRVKPVPYLIANQLISSDWRCLAVCPVTAYHGARATVAL